LTRFKLELVEGRIEFKTVNSNSIYSECAERTEASKTRRISRTKHRGSNQRFKVADINVHSVKDTSNMETDRLTRVDGRRCTVVLRAETPLGSRRNARTKKRWKQGEAS
jgi:hypothetical protein